MALLLTYVYIQIEIDKYIFIIDIIVEYFKNLEGFMLLIVLSLFHYIEYYVNIQIKTFLFKYGKSIKVFTAL